MMRLLLIILGTIWDATACNIRYCLKHGSPDGIFPPHLSDADDDNVEAQAAHMYIEVQLYALDSGGALKVCTSVAPNIASPGSTFHPGGDAVVCAQAAPTVPSPADLEHDHVESLWACSEIDI